ncbi:uncharacterized protein LOC144372554 [Ictidomys tridecemlineatus]
MPQSTYQMKNVWHTLNAQRLLQLVFPESLGEMTCEDPKETESRRVWTLNPKPEAGARAGPSEVPRQPWPGAPSAPRVKGLAGGGGGRGSPPPRVIGCAARAPGSCAPPLARGGPRLPGSVRQSRALASGEPGARPGQPAAPSELRSALGARARVGAGAASPSRQPEPPAGAASRKPRAGSRSRSRAEAEHARCGDGGLLLHILMGLSGADRTLYCLQLGPGASFKFMATLLLDDCNYFCQPVDYNRASSGWRACAGGATQRLLSL